MENVTRAYRTLSNKQLRAEYDDSLPAPLTSLTKVRMEWSRAMQSTRDALNAMAELLRALFFHGDVRRAAQMISSGLSQLMSSPSSSSMVMDRLPLLEALSLLPSHYDRVMLMMERLWEARQTIFSLLIAVLVLV